MEITKPKEYLNYPTHAEISEALGLSKAQFNLLLEKSEKEIKKLEHDGTIHSVLARCKTPNGNRPLRLFHPKVQSIIAEKKKEVDEARRKLNHSASAIYVEHGVHPEFTVGLFNKGIIEGFTSSALGKGGVFIYSDQIRKLVSLAKKAKKVCKPKNFYSFPQLEAYKPDGKTPVEKLASFLSAFQTRDPGLTREIFIEKLKEHGITGKHVAEHHSEMAENHNNALDELQTLRSTEGKNMMHAYKRGEDRHENPWVPIGTTFAEKKLIATVNAYSKPKEYLEGIFPQLRRNH